MDCSECKWWGREGEERGWDGYMWGREGMGAGQKGAWEKRSSGNRAVSKPGGRNSKVNPDLKGRGGGPKKRRTVVRYTNGGGGRMGRMTD